MSLLTLLLIFYLISWVWTCLRLWGKRTSWVDKRSAYQTSAIVAVLCWAVVAGVWWLIKWLL
jgi:hypothetical protein